MEASPSQPQSMIDTTDALEAVSACQSMKNLMFLLIILGLIICQLVFWMNHFGLISNPEAASCSNSICPANTACCAQGGAQANAFEPENTGAIVYLTAAIESEEVDEQPATPIEETIDEIVDSANQTQPEEEVLLEEESDLIPAEIPTEDATPEMLVPAEDTQPEEDQPEEAAEKEPLADKLALFQISSGCAAKLVTVCNCIILVAAVLYCLTLLICLKVSLVGRLGGVSHIARAFFVSLFLLVVLVPWQKVLPGFMIGVLWAPKAIWCECWSRADGSLFWKTMLYLRFCGLWLLAVWLLLSAQGRSARWARATLRRLGVVK